MLLVNRRLASVALLSGMAYRQETPFLSKQPAIYHDQASFFANSVLPFMAAPGVDVAPSQDILLALKNPATTIVDARSVDEIVKDGYWKTDRQAWVNAQCTIEGGCPLLSVAAESLIHDKKAPVIVYCSSGKRANEAKKVLESMGYKNVLNAGAFPGDVVSYLK